MITKENILGSNLILTNKKRYSMLKRYWFCIGGKVGGKLEIFRDIQKSCNAPTTNTIFKSKKIDYVKVIDNSFSNFILLIILL